MPVEVARKSRENQKSSYKTATTVSYIVAVTVIVALLSWLVDVVRIGSFHRASMELAGHVS